jgi:hypothetical protein
MLSIRIEPLAKDIAILISDTLSPAAQSRAFADFARKEIDRADADNATVLGRIVPKTITVDGRREAPLDSVRPDGRIIVEWDVAVDVLQFIAGELIAGSPVGQAPDKHPGLYRDSHQIFADGIEIKIGETIPSGTEEIVFLNSVPYSRTLEMGTRRMRVPLHLYEKTAQKAARRFGNMAKVRFTFRAPIAGKIAPYVTLGGRRGNPSKEVRSAHNRERDNRVPAIVVTFR